MAFKTFKKPIPLKYKIATNNQDVNTKEGVVMANKGDFIMTGTTNEVWPIPAKTFKKTYQIIDENFASKKKIIVYALKIQKPLKVKLSWGKNNIINGNIGDYLVQYSGDDYGVVGNQIFQETYEF